MITKFNHWKIFEHLGEGTQTFVADLSMYGKNSNLSIYGCPHSFGDSIDDATGTLTYSILVDHRKGGIEKIVFRVEKIDLVLKVIRKNESGEEEELEIEHNVEGKDIEEEQVKVETLEFPWYLDQMDITLSEDNDGELETSKVKYELTFGKKE
jgi:hypothetical protein